MSIAEGIVDEVCSSELSVGDIQAHFMYAIERLQDAYAELENASLDDVVTRISDAQYYIEEALNELGG